MSLTKEWRVIMMTPGDVMPDELMSTLDRKLGKSIQVVEVMAKMRPVPDEFTAAKMAQTKG